MRSREKNHQDKLAEWTKWILECRESGKPVKQWCAEKGCSTTTFYRWKREIFGSASETEKEDAVDTMNQEVEASKTTVVLAEVPVTQCSNQSKETREKRFEPVAIIRMGRINVELSAMLAEQVIKQMEVWMRC